MMTVSPEPEEHLVWGSSSWSTATEWSLCVLGEDALRPRDASAESQVFGDASVNVLRHRTVSLKQQCVGSTPPFRTPFCFTGLCWKQCLWSCASELYVHEVVLILHCAEHALQQLSSSSLWSSRTASLLGNGHCTRKIWIYPTACSVARRALRKLNVLQMLWLGCIQSACEVGDKEVDQEQQLQGILVFQGAAQW